MEDFERRWRDMGCPTLETACEEIERSHRDRDALTKRAVAAEAAADVLRNEAVKSMYTSEDVNTARRFARAWKRCARMLNGALQLGSLECENAERARDEALKEVERLRRVLGEIADDTIPCAGDDLRDAARAALEPRQ